MIDFDRYKFPIAALVALSQTAVLGYMIESRAQILRNGKEVVLQTEPVDPRDLLRGDYVTLGYPLSLVSASIIQGEKPVNQGSASVYVALIKGTEDPWVFARASWQPIADLGAQEVVIVGQTPGYYSQDASAIVPLSFGIERFYVPEGQGREIEEGQAQKQVLVTVAIDKKGRAQIKSLRLDGKALYEEPLY